MSLRHGGRRSLPAQVVISKVAVRPWDKVQSSPLALPCSITRRHSQKDTFRSRPRREHNHIKDIRM